MMLLRALLFVVLVTSAVLASSHCPDSFNFVGLGQPCDDSSLCREWLFCNSSSYCQELPAVGDNCTVGGNWDSCAPLGAESSYLRCEAGNFTCVAVHRDNGDPCNTGDHCLSGNCTDGKCSGWTPMGGECSIDAYQWNCADGLTCLTNGPLNATTTCQPPRAIGAECTADLMAWNAGYGTAYTELTPVGICAPSSACLAVSSTQWNCTKLYSGQEGDMCRFNAPGVDPSEFPAPPYVGTPYCDYNLTCSCNGTEAQCASATDAPLFCKPYAKKQPKNCTQSLPGGWGECRFGSACNCTGSTDAATCKPYIGGDECTPLLQSWVTCLKHHKCNHAPAQLLDQQLLFAGHGNPGTCPKCTKQMEQFQCCQGASFTTKARGYAKDAPQSIEATDRKFAYTPARNPTGKMCSSPHTLPNWVIPVVVLGGIVVVITIVVILYILLPRNYDQASGYEKING